VESSSLFVGFPKVPPLICGKKTCDG
ncbi:hypothetical protein A2U01_0057364, partial [Trifolium medium]|nr:hypothetical protein [Trifolium medium]